MVCVPLAPAKIQFFGLISANFENPFLAHTGAYILAHTGAN